MKVKARSCIAALLSAAVVALSAAAASADAVSTLPGDVDNDGVVTSGDALTILRYSVGFGDLTVQQLETADVTGDGEVTSADALDVLRLSMYVDGEFVPPVDAEAEKAVKAASAAANAISKGNFKDLVYYTSNTILYHYTYEAFMGYDDKSAYDDMIIENYGSDDLSMLSFIVWGFPASMTDKYGKGSVSAEFADAKEFAFDKTKLEAELAEYYRELPKYSVVQYPEAGSGITIKEKDGDIKVKFNGKDYLLSKASSSGSVTYDEEPQLDFGKGYKVSVKVGGKDTGKTVRVIYVDGRYRVMVPDLMDALSIK